MNKTTLVGVLAALLLIGGYFVAHKNQGVVVLSPASGPVGTRVEISIGGVDDDAITRVYFVSEKGGVSQPYSAAGYPLSAFAVPENILGTEFQCEALSPECLPASIKTSAGAYEMYAIYKKKDGREVTSGRAVFTVI